MATANPLSLPHTSLTFNQSNPLEEFVAPRERIEVPNHILDTSQYVKKIFNLNHNVYEFL